MTKIVVLGRFQPLHNGHAHLITTAADYGDILTVAIGSAQAPESVENPWSAEERCEMVEAWAKSEEIKIEVVCIPDIDDPPNWVAHASKYHGEGTLATSDATTAELYRDSGWTVIDIPQTEREDFQGWRVRETLKMLSTIDDDEAFASVMENSLPPAIINWFLEDNYRVYRLSILGPDVEPVV
jgi:nicotinamide-nucleotide adenylyltransferase